MKKTAAKLKQHEPLLTVTALEETIGMPFAFVAPLINRGMFPQPIHMRPPLWTERAVKAWHSRAIKCA